MHVTTPDLTIGPEHYWWPYWLYYMRGVYENFALKEWCRTDNHDTFHMPMQNFMLNQPYSMNDFGWCNLEMDACINHEMDATFFGDQLHCPKSKTYRNFVN